MAPIKYLENKKASPLLFPTISMFSIPRICLLLFLFMLPMSCGKDDTGPIYLGTRVCFKTQHHERAITPAEVYIKYGATEFPGYEDLSVFDTMFITNEFGDVCFPIVPLGPHWVVGYGYDSLLEEYIRGSLSFEISSLRAPWDSILYVSEY